MLQFNFIKNGKPTQYDKRQWLEVVPRKPRFVECPVSKRKTQRRLIQEASDRQAKHPDMGRVEKAVKYFKEKREQGRLDVDLASFSSRDSLYEYNCLLGGSLGAGNRVVITNHEKIANCDH